MPPVRVARVIQQIIERRSPRLRYTVGAQATMLTLLRRLLPQSGFELLARRMFGMEGRSLSHRT